MTEHDRIRAERAETVLDSIDPTEDEVLDALCGIQSTDAPELVELMEGLEDLLTTIRKGK